jgi:stearoyl-CoA desaturase (delta-9 desaturase)
MLHHQRPERPGDPYGPHLGWLGSYLAIESSQKLDTNISELEYNALVSSIKHIGISINSYDDFKRTGSIEKVASYLWRTFVIQVLWVGGVFSLGGISYVAAWFSSIFMTTFLMRDFNWWGHGGNFRKMKRQGWEFEKNSSARNQWFYGYLAGEWHDNHHNYPMSANSAFLSGQIDVAFKFIKLMQRVGWVDSYFDARPTFENKYSKIPAIS